MTDKEIVKALRCCADKNCKGCPMVVKANCRETVANLSWDIINRQRAEIEELNRHLAIWKDIAHRETKYVEMARAEAIKEFAERGAIQSESSETSIATLN